MNMRDTIEKALAALVYYGSKQPSLQSHARGTYHHAVIPRKDR